VCVCVCARACVCVRARARCVNDLLPGYLFAVVLIKCFMLGVNV